MEKPCLLLLEATSLGLGRRTRSALTKAQSFFFFFPLIYAYGQEQSVIEFKPDDGRLKTAVF
jgi:hypothetical protein